MFCMGKQRVSMQGSRVFFIKILIWNWSDTKLLPFLDEYVRGDANLPIFSRHSLGLSAILNVCILHKVHPSKVCLKRIYRVKENVTL